MHNRADNIKLTHILNDTTINNSAATSDAVDMQGMIEATFQCHATAVAGSGAVAWTIQESADNSSYSTLSGFTAAHTDAMDDTTKYINVRADQMTNGKRYLKLIATETGSQNATVLAEVLTIPKQLPPA